MDFSKVTEIRIPEGNVLEIAETSTGRILWGNAIAKGLTFVANSSSAPVVMNISTDTDTEYRVNSGAWTKATADKKISGTKIQLRCRNKTSAQNIANLFDSTSGKCKVYGYLSDLLDWKKRLAKTLTYEENCFQNAFSGCSYITDASGLILPTTTVASMYMYAFANCDSLTKAPALPATEVADYAYQDMFEYCSSLTAMPEIKATKIGTQSFYEMFAYCTKLTNTTASKVSNAAGESAFAYMFRESGLSTGMDITGITSTDKYGCTFEGMYMGCTNLTAASMPTKITIGNGALSVFARMFRGCTSLVNPPTIPTISLNSTEDETAHMFEEMFYGCTKLAGLPTLQNKTTYAGTGCQFANMFNGCTSITSIPDNYLKGLTKAAYQEYCGMFSGCTGLTSLGSIFGDGAFAVNNYGCNEVFSQMFYGCTKLASMPSSTWLTIEAVTQNSFYQMFYNCTSLKTAQGIVAKDNGSEAWNLDNCFHEMFTSCTSMTSATIDTSNIKRLNNSEFGYMFNKCSALQTVTMSLAGLTTVDDGATYDYEFDHMFDSCTVLKAIPFVLPSTVKKLGTYACSCMFGSCKALTKVPDDFFGGVTTVGNNCCESMFSGCAALIDVPIDLVANITSLSDSCYKFMFYGTACRLPIDLPATTLANNCYYSMYTSCPSMFASTTETGYYVYAWRVPSDEDITNNTATTPTSNMFSSIGSGVSKWTGTPSLNTTYYFLQTAYVKLESDSGTAMTFNSASAASLTYSLDNTTYQTVAANTDISCPKGVIYLKGSSGIATRVGSNATGADKDVSGVFKVTCATNDVKVSGDARALVKADSFGSITSFTETYMFGNLFRNQTAIKDISKFVIGATGEESCYSMFRNCDSLTKISAHLLPCDNVATCAYEDILAYNSGLTELPKNLLPATTAASGAYQYMFQACPNLKKLPKINLTKVDYRTCQYMYYGCSGLEELEDGMFDTITEVTCNDGMQYMFQACTKLKKVSAKFSKLTYAARGAFYYMFSGCSLLETVPTDMFPVLTTIGYGTMAGMFNYCTKLLNAPELPATNFTAYDRTVTNATSTRSGSNYEGMFTNCFSMETGPSKLPAETPAEKCYMNMFYRCYKLTKAPDISLKTTVAYCCYGMFAGCTALTTPPTALYATDLATYCYYAMFTGCTSLLRTPQIFVKSATYQSCMAYMFSTNTINNVSFTSCTSLKYLNFVYQITTVGVSAMYYMFYGCSALEDIVDVSSTAPVASNGMVSAYANTNVHISTTQTGEYNVSVTIPTASDSSPFYNMFAGTAGTYTGNTYTAGTTYYMKPASNTYVKLRSRAGTAFTLTQNNGSLQYSHNGTDWTNMTKGTAITANFGHVYLRNGSTNTAVGGSGKTAYLAISSSTNDIIAAGYLKDLLNYNGSYSMSNYTFAHLFYGNTALYDVSGIVLPSNLGSTEYVGQGIFMNCSNLIYPCVLPAAKVSWGSYESMFEECKNLKYPCELPITSITTRSLNYMFSNCTSMKASTTQDSTYTHAWTMPSVGASNGNATDMMFGVTGFNRIPVNGTTYYFAVA